MRRDVMMVPTFLNTSRTPSARDGSAAGGQHWARIAEVDAAVQSVLATQGRGPQGGHGEAGPEVFGERLFALRHAEALGGGTREVRVAAATVVTPLARDLLKKLGIAI